MRWRQPRSIHLGDEHGCVQLVDAGGETTRRREPRGVSGTLEVSPTGSIPHRENPARQVANDKVEASRAKLHLGQEAPKGIRPLTRVAVKQHKDKQRQEPDPPQPKFTGREGAAKRRLDGFHLIKPRGAPVWDGTATNPGFRRTQRPFKVGLQRTSPMCPAFHRSPEFGFQAADPTDVVGRLVLLSGCRQ